MECESLTRRIVDFIVDRILAFTDYFVIRKHVTLSETGMFFLSVLMVIWLGFFGFSDSVETGIRSNNVMFIVFLILAIFHLITMLVKNQLWRTVALAAYAFTWCFLIFVTTSVIGYKTPLIPFLIVATFKSAFIAVRLQRNVT